jgi:hypothetical protein
MSLGSDNAHRFLCLDFSLFGFTLKEGSEIHQYSWLIRVRQGREREIYFCYFVRNLNKIWEFVFATLFGSWEN